MNAPRPPIPSTPAGTPPQEVQDHTRLEEPAEAPADQAAAAHDDMPVETAASTPVPAAAAPAPVAAAPTGWAPPRAGLAGTVATIVLALAGVLVVLYAWRLPPFATALQSTDNAYVRGQTTIVSPQTSGYVAEVPVQDFQTVEAGQVLVRIDERIYRQRVEQAQATLAGQIASLDNSAQTRRSREATVASQVAAVGNARAQLARARADLQRVDALVADGSVSLRERDQTVAALRQAEAAVEQARAAGEIARQDVRAVTVGRAGLEAGVEGARAALALAEIDLANTVVRAPRAGQLSEVSVRAGQYVTAGTQLMFLVPARLWIIANYKEAQTAAMAPGQPVRFRVDALDRAELTGRVEQLAPAAGSEFAVLKADNATGNFVKVAQRIAVRIAIDPGQPLAARLRPGMSVETMVDTTGARTAPVPATGGAADPGAATAPSGAGTAPPSADAPVPGAAR